MKKWLSIIFLALLTTACTANNSDTASPSPGNNNDEGLTHTFDDGVQTDEEILIEARDHINMNRTANDYLSRAEAEELLREHLNIDDNGNIAVFFVREENDNYIIQVNHLERNSSETFIVDPTTRKITKQRVQK